MTLLRKTGCACSLAALATALSACGSDDELNVPRPSEPLSVGPIELVAGQTLGGPARELNVDDGPRFSGLAMWNDGQCTAFYAVSSALDLNQDGPAYVLTNGHCASDAHSPNEVSLADPSARPQEVSFRVFADSKRAATQERAKRVVYSTMKGVDLAVVELSSSRFALRKKGVVPFVIAKEQPTEGEPIAYAGHPGFQPAKLSACLLERRVPMVLEAPWHWFDAEANRCDGIAVGSSGSPVFSLATGNVVAIVNTGNVSDPVIRCGYGAPCEVGPRELSWVAHRNYAIPLGALNGCFDARGVFDLALAGCSLDRGVQMMASTEVGEVVTASALGQNVSVEFSLENRGLTHYRSLAGPPGSIDCRDSNAYEPSVAWQDASTISAAFAGQAGYGLLCVLAGAGADETTSAWQDSRQPTVAVVRIDPP